MLTFQFTVSIALIACVLIIFKQLQYVKHSDLGFNRELLLKFNLPFSINNPESFKQEIEKLPFVRSSTLSHGCPGYIRSSSENTFKKNNIYVGDNYLKTMGIELLEGREFLKSDLNKVCFINEEAKRKYEFSDIKAKKVKYGEDTYEVAGVVKNFNTESLHSAITPLLLIYSTDIKLDNLSVRLTAGNTSQYLTQMKQVWQKFCPNEPFEFTFYDQLFQAMYAKEENLSISITFFSIIAIALTCMGILGQIIMICYKRTKEIGIRKVNGARVTEILALLNKDFLKWVAIAFVIATPIAYYAMNKWLQNFAYRTELSWWVFTLAGAAAMLIALATVSWQSWRAASRNPVESLRSE